VREVQTAANNAAEQAKHVVTDVAHKVRRKLVGKLRRCLQIVGGQVCRKPELLGCVAAGSNAHLPSVISEDELAKQLLCVSTNSSKAYFKDSYLLLFRLRSSPNILLLVGNRSTRPLLRPLSGLLTT
jgi:hypothetical protein